jgi:hypothetical protein
MELMSPSTRRFQRRLCRQLSIGRLRLVVLALVLVGCTPTLDWREVRPVGGQLLLMFPCKPTSQTREIRLVGQAGSMLMQACRAGEVTWALGQMDVGDPARVGPVLAELRAAAQAKMGAPKQAWTALPPGLGATPNDQSGQASFVTTGPAGQALQMHQALFAHGTWVFQASVLGAAIPQEGLSNYLGSLRVLR